MIRLLANAKSIARRRPVLVGAVCVFTVLCLTYLGSIDIRASWGAEITGDEPFYLVTTQSLITDRDLNTANQFESSQYESFFDHADGLWFQSKPTENGSLLSPHNPGLSVLLVPGLSMGGLLGAQLQMVLLAALTFALSFAFIARTLRTYAGALFATIVIGLTATPFIYSSEIYPEIPAALALVLALMLANRDHQTIPSSLLIVLVLSTLPWLGTKYAALAAIVGLYVCIRSHFRARVLILGAGAASGLLYAWFHVATFGGLTPYNVNIVYAGQSAGQLFAEHFSYADRVYRLWGLFIDQRFGLARWAPIMLVALVSLPVAWRLGGMGKLVVCLVTTQVAIATFVAITMMGWWFPGRTLMTVLPLLAMPLALVLRDAGRWARRIIWSLAVYSVAVTAVLALAGHTREVAIAVNPFDLQNPIFRIPVALFPDYRAWDTHTWAATVAWLIALSLVTSAPGRRIAAILRPLRRRMTGIR